MVLGIFALSTILNLIFQTCVLPYFSINGVIGNTSIILIVCISLFLRGSSGKVIGLLLGMVEDMLFGSVIGVRALSYLLIGHLCDSLERNYMTESLTETGILLAGSIVGFNLVYYGLMYVFFDIGSLLSFLKNRLAIELIYSGVLFVPIYRIYRNIFTIKPIKFMRD